MEDIRIGRKQSTQYYSKVATAATPTLLVPANVKRVALLISNPSAVTIYVGPKEVVTGLNTGIVLPTGLPFIQLRIEDIGDAIYQEWWFFPASATPTAFAMSTELQER